MVFAEMEAGGFTFRVLSESEEKAKLAILEGWTSHCQQFGYSTKSLTVEALDEQFSINIMEMRAGPCYRDYAEVPSHLQEETQRRRPLG